MELSKGSVARINWILTGFCTLVSLVISSPKKSNGVSVDDILVSLGIILFLLVPAVIVTLLVRRFLDFGAWAL